MLEAQPFDPKNNDQVVQVRLLLPTITPFDSF
jgi:hypothetical protein